MRERGHHPADQRNISSQGVCGRGRRAGGKPTRPYQDLADLRIGDSGFSFGSLQRKILNRAAILGADAVIFAKPQTQTLHEVAVEPLYDSWGYNSPYYGTPWGDGGYGGPVGSWGPWGGGYAGSVAVPYDEVTRMLKGTAIRYTDSTGRGDRSELGETGSQRESVQHQEFVRHSISDHQAGP